MTADTVRVKGADTLERTLNTFARGLDDMPDAQRAAGAQVLQDARRRVPIRTGRLASSGFSTGTGSTAVAGFSADHAGPIEFGVGPRVGLRGPHNIRPHRFLDSAVDAQTDAVVGILTDAVQARLAHVKGA